MDLPFSVDISEPVANTFVGHRNNVHNTTTHNKQTNMGKKSKLGHNPSTVSTKELVEMENKEDAGKDVSVLPSETKETQNYRSREHVTFCTLLMLCEIAVVILYGVWFDYAYEESTAEGVQRFYNYFRDVNVMIFFGFGFLMTFLRKYGYSAIGTVVAIKIAH